MDNAEAEADAARSRSEEAWLRDLARLRLEAKERFGDVAWLAEGTQRLVYAHKCIVYARATGTSNLLLSRTVGARADTRRGFVEHTHTHPHRQLAAEIHGPPA